MYHIMATKTKRNDEEEEEEEEGKSTWSNKNESQARCLYKPFISCFKCEENRPLITSWIILNPATAMSMNTNTLIHTKRILYCWCRIITMCTYVYDINNQHAKFSFRGGTNHKNYPTAGVGNFIHYQKQNFWFLKKN